MENLYSLKMLSQRAHFVLYCIPFIEVSDIYLRPYLMYNIFSRKNAKNIPQTEVPMNQDYY